MPEEIKDPVVVERMCAKKQQLEARIARDVYNAFNTGVALRKLQTFAKIVLTQMNKGDQSIVSKAIANESAMRLWKKMGKSALGLQQYAMNANLRSTLDASDCADIIRLAGTWVELGGLIAKGASGKTKDAWGKNVSVSESVKDAFRPGVMTGKGEWKKEVEAVWADGKGKFAGAPPRRVRGAGHAIEAHVIDLMRDPATFSGMAGLPGNKKVRGQRATGTSTVLKIDRLFGLLVGCDISGTTTDTIFALEVWGGGVFTATYYLLPLATIVHNMHHTLIEVALSLSINGIVDYRIGFYKSLLPRGLVAPELRLVEQALSSAQQMMQTWGLHFLCYYDGGQDPAGCFHFSGREVDRFQVAPISQGLTMLEKAPGLGAYPTRAEVQKLLQSYYRW